MKGKDISINKGISFEVYTNSDKTIPGAAPSRSSVALGPIASGGAPSPQAANAGSAPGLTAGTATVTVTSTVAAAEIEVDGSFVGSTPTTLQLSSGPHLVSVKGNEKTWERKVQITAGSTISLTAVLK